MRPNGVCDPIFVGGPPIYPPCPVAVYDAAPLDAHVFAYFAVFCIILLAAVLVAAILSSSISD